MDTAIQQFERNLESVRHLGIIYEAFVNRVTPAISLDELLRAELVLAVGVLDCYVHDLVRIGMSKAFEVGGGESNSFLNFGISLQAVKTLLSTASAEDRRYLFEEEIRRLHGYRTFQTAENISQALTLIGIKSIWEKVSTRLGIPPADVRDHINIIVDRRNRISHESDIDPSLGVGVKYPIDLAMVNKAVAFIESVVQAIHGTARFEIT